MQTLTKYTADVRTYTFDYSQLDELLEADTIGSIVSVTASPSGLTVGQTSIVGQTVEAILSSGNSGVTYVVSAIVTTSSGATLEGQGALTIL